MDMKELFKKMREHGRWVRSIFGEENLAAVPLFDECLSYPIEDLAELTRMTEKIESCTTEEEMRSLLPAFKKKREEIEAKKRPAGKIFLWNGEIPTLTEYTDNSEYLYNHNPDFEPFMYEMLLDESVTPKGAILFCAGGDHGFPVLCEAYQSALDFLERGYQCFLLLNRPNLNPWTDKEAGADAARAIRIIRANAEKYRIREDNIAYAGFSNGGLTGEGCIRYYSGNKTMKDVFPGYTPDALDDVSADMNAFLCIYGPRMHDAVFDYEGVVYPPTFHAVGMEDFNLENIQALYPELVSHGIYCEVHTFSGVPHGMAGRRLVDGYVKYPNFETWIILADSFLLHVFARG